MSDTTRTETLIAADGGEFAGLLTLPATGSGPGIVLIQEIFGVNDYIRNVARKLAAQGYVVLAPDLYWRIEPGVQLNSDDDFGAAIALVQQLDLDGAVADCTTTLDHLRGLPEVTGGAGIVGFCLGGTLGYLTAATADPDAVVSYYGSMVPERLDVIDSITCPVLFHFGGADAFIPAEKVAPLVDAVAARDHLELVVHDGAGHAFDHDDSTSFGHPAAAAAAWDHTVAFLAKHLPAG